MRGESGHILSKVWLNLDCMALAYQTARREPKSDVVSMVCAEIDKAADKVSSEWARGFLSDARAAISAKRSVTGAIPSDNKERGMLLTAIIAADNLDGAELTERVFSLRTFSDSKAFENKVRQRLVRILRRYLDTDDDAPDDDILRQIGIVKYPEQFEFRGDLKLCFKDGEVSFLPLRGGGVIYSTELDSGRIALGASVKSIITIENRANYIEYIRIVNNVEELVIYHGGQYSPRKRKFLRAVAGAMSASCTWRHWGDIDYGGFLMLSRLRREIYSPAVPYRMDADELARGENYAARIDKRYAAKLQTLKIRPELADSYDCIDYMIKNMVRLEQEAMLVM
jgi:hypothetical protein